jgi:hypothetical protein
MAELEMTISTFLQIMPVPGGEVLYPAEEGNGRRNR